MRIRLACFGALLLCAGFSCGAAAGEAGALRWSREINGAQVRAIRKVGPGRLWVGTEDKGIFEVDTTGTLPPKPVPDEGLPDDTVLALATDGLGRVWAGHGRSGVSVYHGRIWKNFDWSAGPLGERVPAIACGPDDVWLATSRGLARYHFRPGEEGWQYFTTCNGFPAESLTSVAVAADGTVYAGSEGAGLIVGKPAFSREVLPASTWRVVDGPQERIYTAAGEGLPSRRVCAIAMAPDGTAYVATTNGLAYGRGDSFRFVRGRDLVRVIQETGGRDAGLPQPPPAPPLDQLPLAEDYCSTVCVDRAGRLYLGHRNSGVEILDPANAFSFLGGYAHDVTRDGAKMRHSLALYPLDTSTLLVGWIGRGLVALPATAGAKEPYLPFDYPLTASEQPFPAPAQSVGESRLARMLQDAADAPDLPVGGLLSAGEDWQTRGDWMGRYGKHEAYLYPVQLHAPAWKRLHSPYTMEFGRGVALQMVPNEYYSWLGVEASMENIYLYSPYLMTRQWSNLNGMGQSNSSYRDGHNLYARLTIPAGYVRCSLYFCNADGGNGGSMSRDYPLRVYDQHNRLLWQGRVYDFRTGVYKRFFLRGPAKYLFVIERAESINAILDAVFWDRLTISKSSVGLQPEEPAFLPWCSTLPFTVTADEGQTLHEDRPSWALWQQYLHRLRERGWFADAPLFMVLLARQAMAESWTPEGQRLLRREAGVWDGEDRRAFARLLQELLERRACLNPTLTE